MKKIFGSFLLLGVLSVGIAACTPAANTKGTLVGKYWVITNTENGTNEPYSDRASSPWEMHIPNETNIIWLYPSGDTNAPFIYHTNDLSIDVVNMKLYIVLDSTNTLTNDYEIRKDNLGTDEIYLGMKLTKDLSNYTVYEVYR